MNPAAAEVPANRRRPWLHAAVAVAIVVAVSLSDAATRSGARSNRRDIAQRQREIAATGARVVLLGNSILDRGVDAAEFSRLAGVPTYKLASNGSASAFWYVTLKNVLAPMEPRPETVVVFFRDTLLTQPDFDVDGKYRAGILHWTTGPEPELERLAFGGGGWLERTATNRWPLVQRRYKFADRVSSLLKEGVSLACGAGKDAADAAVDRAFDTARMDPRQLTARQEAETAGKTRQDFDFARDVERSFLPSMVSIARERGIRLVFVRTRRRIDALGSRRDEAALHRYVAGLRAYLEQNGCPLYDFTGEERLTLDMFADGDHLRPDTGRVVFTKALANALGPAIARR